MSTKRFKELKSLSQDELALKIREIGAEFFQTRMQHITGQLKDTAKLWRLRKDMARMKTLQTMKPEASAVTTPSHSVGDSVKKVSKPKTASKKATPKKKSIQ